MTVHEILLIIDSARLALLVAVNPLGALLWLSGRVLVDTLGMFVL